MARRGKKYRDSIEKVDRTSTYAPVEAVALVKEMAKARFDETVELHLNLNVDPRHADQQVRSTVSLPAGTGKSLRIMVFAEGEAATAAEAAGADYVGTDEYVKKIQDGWLEFDVAVAIPQAMGKIGRLGRVLGPRGMMPSPKAGTVVQPDDVSDTISELRKGRAEFRVDRTANLHIPIGKTSFTEEQLQQNFGAVMEAVLRARPASVKGQYIKTLTITSTMTPGVRIDIAAARDFKVA